MDTLVILGGGESGVGAAILGKTKGFNVFLSDSGQIPERYRTQLDEEGIEWEQGGHSMDRILQADEVVKSPGIPPTAPVIEAIVAKGIPVISEIELAGRYTDARMVCITGSNGKTTTTLLTYHILKDAGVNVGLAGNVGRSLALQVAREHHDVYVIELSSFQLENMYDFHANIAVLLNITPDHLDRYGYSMDNYTDAKLRVLRNLRPQDSFVHWADDPVVTARISGGLATPARDLAFAARPAAGAAAFADGGMLHLPGTLEMPLTELSLPGTHNLLNAMAAALAARAIGAGPEAIRRGLATFAPVEHRLEPAGTVGGVRWINDSKATNVNSCFYALGAMDTPTVLILGGKDKGNDYNEILPLVREKVKAMGLHNEKITDFFSPHVRVESTSSLEAAVDACRRLAAPGDTVLLSPCCASFDLFTSYEDRGRRFKQAVKDLENA